MSSLIEQIAKEADTTFAKDVTDPDFADNLNKLIRYVGKLQASDVKLDESLQTVRSGIDDEELCSYIQVLLTKTFSIGIFIVKSGGRIPLHDHPGMHGIMKVIRGSVRILSYTSVGDEAGDNVAPQDVRNMVKRTQRKYLIPVNKHEPVTVGEKDQPCVLKPTEGNFHEVWPVGDMAVFVDVLAPPYDMVERDCTFYAALETTKPDAAIKTWLIKTPPDEFYSNCLPYCGPKLKL